MSYALGLDAGRPRPAGLLINAGFIPTVEGWAPDLEGRRGLPVAIAHGATDPIMAVALRPRRRRVAGRRRPRRPLLRAPRRPPPRPGRRRHRRRLPRRGPALQLTARRATRRGPRAPSRCPSPPPRRPKAPSPVISISLSFSPAAVRIVSLTAALSSTAAPRFSQPPPAGPPSTAATSAGVSAIGAPSGSPRRVSGWTSRRRSVTPMATARPENIDCCWLAATTPASVSPSWR